jgi:streptogramin lyase
MIPKGLFSQIKMHLYWVILAGFMVLALRLELYAQDTLKPFVVTPRLSNASSVRAHPEGGFWIVETGRNRLLRIDNNGRRIDSLGKAGFSSYAFNAPSFADLTNGMKWFVLDAGNSRVQVFDRRKQFLVTVDRFRTGAVEVEIEPAAIAVDLLGRLFVLDTKKRLGFRFKPNGQPDQQLPLPGTVGAAQNLVLAASDDKLWLLDKNSRSLWILNSDLIQTGLHLLPENGIDVLATRDRVWVLAGRTVRILNHRGGIEREFRIPDTLSVVSIAVHPEGLVLLTTDALWLARF